jgi:hypothetical protein
LPFEKRGVFIERVVARLQPQRGFTDADLDDAVRAASTGLIQSAARWRTNFAKPPELLGRAVLDLALSILRLSQ